MNSSTILLSIVFSLLIGCSSSDQSAGFSASDIGVAIRTEVATVVSRRVVDLKGGGGVGGSKSQAVTTGATAGAILGAASSRRSIFGGALAGAGLGSLIGAGINALSKPSQAIEYVLRTRDGSTLSVLQKTSIDIAVGQKVLIHYNPKNQTISLEQLAYQNDV